MTTTSESPTAYQTYIDGRWLEARDGAVHDVINPATEEVIATVPDAGREEMRSAIAAARRAFDEGPWPRMSPADRGRGGSSI